MHAYRRGDRDKESLKKERSSEPIENKTFPYIGQWYS